MSSIARTVSAIGWSLSPASSAIASNCFRFGMYWYTIASGAFAAHFAIVSGTALPSTMGKSKKRGGLRGFGDQAAAKARVALVKKSASAISLSLLTLAARATSSAFGSRLAARQQGLIA